MTKRVLQLNSYLVYGGNRDERVYLAERPEITAAAETAYRFVQLGWDKVEIHERWVCCPGSSQPCETREVLIWRKSDGEIRATRAKLDCPADYPPLGWCRVEP